MEEIDGNRDRALKEKYMEKTAGQRQNKIITAAGLVLLAMAVMGQLAARNITGFA